MKSLAYFKNEVAQKYGYKCFDHHNFDAEKIHDLAAELYAAYRAKEAKKESNDLIAEQARLIRSLTKQVEDLEDSQRRRNEWLAQAKREAGYSQQESFDNVWKYTLQKANHEHR